MSRHLSSSGCRATLPQLSPHLLLNYGLVTTSIYPPWRVLSAGNQVVDTTVTGLVVNGLTHYTGHR